jgi:hypothetical protein
MKGLVPTFAVPAVLALFVGAGFAGAQMPRHPAPPSPAPLPAMGIYEGESSGGNFQEALNEAVSQASRAEKGVFRYEVSHIGGEFGGPGSVHTLKVQISTGSRPKMPVEVAK